MKDWLQIFIDKYVNKKSRNYFILSEDENRPGILCVDCDELFSCVKDGMDHICTYKRNIKNEN